MIYKPQRHNIISKMHLKVYLILFSLNCLNIYSLPTISNLNPTINTIESDQCYLSKEIRNEIANYGPIVDKIIKSVVAGEHKGQSWYELSKFIDKFGSRISGSKNLENAIDYMLEKSKELQLDNIHGEPVVVPHWIRGHEEATLLKPRVYKMNILGFGGSVGTPKDGIIAPVIVVESFDELKQRAAEAKDKIVVFAEKFIDYGTTVQYRQYGAARAAEVGAVASLVRSIAPFSINTPHTGQMDYSANITKIPSAAITIEDAEWLLRMHKRGIDIEIKLYMEAHTLPDVVSRNTVVEVTGTQDPQKFVLISGHLDSWDVGQGAMDDGAGAFISWYSIALLKKLGLKPRRTVRAVLWTGEEEGLIGAFAYRAAHNNSDIVMLMESDEGTFNPQGLVLKASPQAQCIMEEILKLLEPIGTNQLTLSNDVGSDIMVWANDNLPMAALKNQNEQYFWFHHSNGDTMTVENANILDKCTALWASVAYVIADMQNLLPR